MAESRQGSRQKRLPRRQLWYPEEHGGGRLGCQTERRAQRLLLTGAKRPESRSTASISPEGLRHSVALARGTYPALSRKLLAPPPH